MWTRWRKRHDARQNVERRNCTINTTRRSWLSLEEKYEKNRGRVRKGDGMILHTDSKRVLFSEHVSNVFTCFDSDRTTQTLLNPQITIMHFFGGKIMQLREQWIQYFPVTCFQTVQTRFSLFEHTVLIIPYIFFVISLQSSQLNYYPINHLDWFDSRTLQRSQQQLQICLYLLQKINKMTACGQKL